MMHGIAPVGNISNRIYCCGVLGCGDPPMAIRIIDVQLRCFLTLRAQKVRPRERGFCGLFLTRLFSLLPDQ